MEEMQSSGGSTGGEVTVGARFLAALFDLVIIPIILGLVFGLLFVQAPLTLRNIVLVFVNIAWTCFRDIKGGAGPGKRMAGIKVIDVNTGGAPRAGQLVLRNVLIWIPFVLLFGLIIESFIIFVSKKDRLGDRWAGCKVVSAK